jgi:hypothetical protein
VIAELVRSSVHDNYSTKHLDTCNLSKIHVDIYFFFNSKPLT